METLGVGETRTTEGSGGRYIDVYGGEVWAGGEGRRGGVQGRGRRPAPVLVSDGSQRLGRAGIAKQRTKP